MTFLIECLYIFFYETTKLLLQAQDCHIGFYLFIQIRLLFSKLESFFNSQFVWCVFVYVCVSQNGELLNHLFKNFELLSIMFLYCTVAFEIKN